MGKKAKPPPAPPPKPKKVGFYEYCTEPTCNWHYISVKEVQSPDAKPDEKCPKGHRIEVFRLDNQAEIPEVSVTVVAIPGRPYGGFVLQLGDVDASRTWEGGVAKPVIADPADDTHHQNARYVAELQRDLMLLGYYSPFRISDFKIGTFTMSMVGGILALKADLTSPSQVRGFGIASENDFTKIEKNPKPPTASPIYYDIRLTNPRAIFRTWETWHSFIDEQKTHIATWKKLFKNLHPNPLSHFKYSIPAPKGSPASTPPEAGDVVGLDADDELQKLTALRTQIAAMPVSKADPARKHGIDSTLHGIDARVKKINQDLDAAAKFIKTYDDALGILNKQLDERLTEIAFTDEELTKSRSTIDWHLESDRVAEAKTFKALVKEAHQQAKKKIAEWLKAPDGQITKMLTDMDSVVADANSTKGVVSRVGAALGNLKTHAAPLRPGFIKFLDKVKGLDTDAWCDAYRKDIREFTRIDPPTAYAIKTMISERKLNGRLCYVQPEGDQLRPWLFEGKEIGERALTSKTNSDVDFGVKALKELVKEVDPTLDDKYAYIVHYAMLLNESGWTQWHVGNKTNGLKFITMGIDWWNLSVPKGSGLQAAVYDEFVTHPGRNRGWAMNRGWGLSQDSPGDDGGTQLRSGGFVKLLTDGTVEDHSNEPALFRWRSGLPIPLDSERLWPAAIAAPRGALETSIRIFYLGWSNTSMKRDCTFENAAKQKYDCRTCLARFEKKDFINSDELITRLKKENFGPIEPFFETAFKDKWATDHKLDTDEKKQKAFASAEFNKALDTAKLKAIEATTIGMDRPKHITHGVDPDKYRKVMNLSAVTDPKDYLEQPCSWLTLRGYYAGISKEGISHVPEVVGQVLGLPPP